MSSLSPAEQLKIYERRVGIMYKLNVVLCALVAVGSMVAAIMLSSWLVFWVGGLATVALLVLCTLGIFAYEDEHGLGPILYIE